MASDDNSPEQSPTTAAAQPPAPYPNNGQPQPPNAAQNTPTPGHPYPGFYPGQAPAGGEGSEGDRNGSTQVFPHIAMHPMAYPGMVVPYPYPGMMAPQAVRTKRRQVKNACTNCQKACKKCDDERPCVRCVKYGIADECVDSQRKERKKGIKRGPYKKRDNKGNAPDGGEGDPNLVAMANGGPDPTAGPSVPYAPVGYPPGFYGQYGNGQPPKDANGQPYYPQYYLTPVAPHPVDPENMPAPGAYYPGPYMGPPVPYGHQPYTAYAMPPGAPSGQPYYPAPPPPKPTGEENTAEEAKQPAKGRRARGAKKATEVVEQAEDSDGGDEEPNKPPVNTATTRAARAAKRQPGAAAAAARNGGTNDAEGGGGGGDE